MNAKTNKVTLNELISLKMASLQLEGKWATSATYQSVLHQIEKNYGIVLMRDVNAGLMNDWKNTNLHAVWDSKLIESQGYSYTEYAQKLELEYGFMKDMIWKASDEELLLHNYQITEEIYAYQQTWDGNTYHYIYKWRQPMEFQLYLAGIRLARELNNLYK